MCRLHNKQSCQQLKCFDGPPPFSILLIQPVKYLPVLESGTMSLNDSDKLVEHYEHP